MSISAPDPDGLCTTSVASESFSSNSSPALSELSVGDKPWDKHRSFADTVESHYQGSEFDHYAGRMHFCSEFLEFGLQPHDDDTLRLRLRNARFCRVRHCPVCQWRRSLQWKAKAYQVLPKIVDKYPTHRWLFVTLTQKNVPINELKAVLAGMNKGFQRLVQLKVWPAVGWLRSTEVTRGKLGDAHPHFHCLLMVPASYFGKGYIKQAQWVEMWRKSMRFDYSPVMDVRAIRQGSQPMQLVPELLKYCTKESDMVSDRAWFLELTRQMHRVKCVTTGGVLKQYLRELEQEPDDLIGDGEDDPAEDQGSLYFGWKRCEKKYRLVE